MNYTHQEKLSLLSEMIELAKSDNKLKQAEVGFIELVADSLGVQVNEVKQLIKNPVKKIVLASEFERIVQFYRLVLVINIDVQTSIKEIVGLKNMGLKMGLPPEAVDEVFQRMDKDKNKIIPTKTLIGIFKKYHN